MRLSQLFAPTLKETPKDAEVISYALLLRAGYVRKVAAGIYDFLPLGIRAVRKVEGIVRDEMDRAGAQEILMPAVQPASLWKESGRWDYYGAELLRFKDRKGGEFCIGPTHEEVVTALVRDDVRSYRELPLNLYQVQAKFRDELRPRAGLMRGREFIMKDAYSFDVDEGASKVSYQRMYDAYCRIFDRCGLRYRPVEADTGAIGGNMSHEFQVLADSGEDAIVSCPSCGYTANVEKAEIQHDPPAHGSADTALETVDTPGCGGVAEVAAFLGVPTSQILKTLVFIADESPVAVVIRGDLDVNEIKVKAVTGAATLRLASDAEVLAATGSPVGFVGPIGLSIPIFADHSVYATTDGVVGAGERDRHTRGFNVARDVAGARAADLRLASAGDTCGRCEAAAFEFFRGIEVGQVFFLGTKYSEAMKCTYLGEDGVERPMVMGCYGIGITRILSAAIEQNHDADGIVWPMALAPAQAIVVPLQMKDEAVVAAAEQIYNDLRSRGVEALIDDRDLRPGAKFKDADLLGIPLRITVGARGLAEGNVELRRRGTDGDALIAVGETVGAVLARIRAEMEVQS